MPRFVGQSTEQIHLLNNNKRVGVLLTNLGTPEKATTSALRSYLREFLSDPRVVEIPRIIWLIILYGLILPLRPAKSAKLYQSIWTKQGSPLLVISKSQQEKVSKKLRENYGEDVMVELAMRYGNPSLSSALNIFKDAGVRRIIILPLYPQYAGPTSGSTFDAVIDIVKKWRWIPDINFISSYHDNPLYIDALAASITDHINQQGKLDKLLLSYHGMPKLFHQMGDPYFEFCQRTTQLLVTKLGLSDNEYTMTFQSRFGKAEWLKPYTDETLKGLAQQGCKKVAIVSPAFSADCLETLEELVTENRDVFLEAGGEDYRYINALNDRADHVEALTSLISPYLKF